MKVTVIVQLPPAASVLGEAGQVLVCAKSALLVPVIVMPLMVNAALPVFFTAKLCGALDVPLIWLPNASALGDKLTAGPLATPVPCKATTWGLPAALEETLTAADSLAVVEGVKVTVIVQLPPAASVLGEAGQVLVCAKSALLVPVIVMPLMVNAALPVFFTVKLWGALVVFSGWLPKASVAGDKLTAGPLVIPIPCKATAWGLPVVALSEMLAKAFSVPAVEGLNVKLTVQLEPTARPLDDVGHVLVWAKSPPFGPVIVIPLKVRAAVPVLVIAKRWAELTVPTACPVNDTLAWESVAAGPGNGGGTFSEEGRSRAQTSPASVAPGRIRTKRSAEASYAPWLFFTVVDRAGPPVTFKSIHCAPLNAQVCAAVGSEPMSTTAPSLGT